MFLHHSTNFPWDGKALNNNYILIFYLTSGFNGLGRDDCEAMNNRHDDPTIYMTDNICIMSETTKMMPQTMKQTED